MYKPERTLKYNYLERIIYFVMLFTAVIGDKVWHYNVGIISITPYRIAIACILVIVIPLRLFNKSFSKLSLKFITFIFLWIIWGLMSLLWTVDPVLGLKEICELIFSLIVYIILIIFSNKDNHGAFREAWIACFILMTILNLVEIYYGYHFQNDYETYFIGTEEYPFYIVGTLGNPNNLASFISLSIPFLVYTIINAKKQTRVISVILVILAIMLLLLTESRINILGVLLGGAVFWTLLHKNYKHNMKFGFIILFVLIIYYAKELLQLGVVGKFGRLAYEMENIGSIKIRINVGLDCLYICIKSCMIGTGAGSVAKILGGNGLPWPTQGIVNPHGYPFEILSQYGIIVFLGYIYIMFQFIKIFKYNIQKTNEDHVRAITGIYLLIVYVFSWFANSAFLEDPINWMALSSLLVLAMSFEPKNNYKIFEKKWYEFV